VKWVTPTLNDQDRSVKIRRNYAVRTNLVGATYERLYRARNDFIHGNALTDETLRLEKSGQQVQWFAAPLFRLALTAFLDLYAREIASESTDEDWGRQIARRMEVRRHQQLSEEAILASDLPPRIPDCTSAIQAPAD
jgi:hypothetical protein